MAGFKIVQTTEKGSQRLFIVPSAWEYKGLLRYPKKSFEYKLARNENSKPNAAWPVMPCKVKRLGFPTYEDADEELSLMLANSDTDVGGREENYSTVDKTDFNDMASQLMLQSQVDVTPQPSAMTTHEEISGETFLIINNETNDIFGTSSQNQPDNNMIIQKLDTILANQNDMMEIHKRFAQRLGNLVLEIETKVEKVMKRVLDSQTVTTLGSVSPIENTAFKLKPIDCIDELEEFELLLLDPVQKSKLMQLYSILCTTSEGHGITCAYKLIDILFTRDFLCQCSWSGGSRGDKIKIALKGYKNVLDFFFRMVLSWDKSFTIDANENFFKLVLRNSEQRKNIKNLRKPAQRKRTRKLKNQSEKYEMTKRVDGHPAETNAEKEEDEDENVEEEKEEEKDSAEEVENNIVHEVEKDLEEESENNLEEEIEKDKENEMEKDLEEELEENFEEDIENEKKNEVEKNLGEEVEDIDKDLEKDMEKGEKKKVKEDILNTIEMVSQNEGCEKREKSCNKFKNFRAVKNPKVRDIDNRMHQTAPKINQQNMGDRSESFNKLKNMKTSPKKIKALDNNNQSVTPPKKIKQSH